MNNYVRLRDSVCENEQCCEWVRVWGFMKVCVDFNDYYKECYSNWLPTYIETPKNIPAFPSSSTDDFESDLALGQMDFQSFQMLSDTAGPIMDPMDEDSFRRELQWDDLADSCLRLLTADDDGDDNEMARLQSFVTLL